MVKMRLEISKKTGYLADFYENPEVHKNELEEYVVVIYVKGCIY